MRKKRINDKGLTAAELGPPCSAQPAASERVANSTFYEECNISTVGRADIFANWSEGPLSALFRPSIKVRFRLPIQPIDATHSLNFSAGEKCFNVFLGRSFSFTIFLLTIVGPSLCFGAGTVVAAIFAFFIETAYGPLLPFASVLATGNLESIQDIKTMSQIR